MLTRKLSLIHVWMEKFFFVFSSDTWYSLPLVNRWRMVNTTPCNTKPFLTLVETEALGLLEGGAPVVVHEVRDDIVLWQHGLFGDEIVELDVNEETDQPIAEVKVVEIEATTKETELEVVLKVAKNMKGTKGKAISRFAPRWRLTTNDLVITDPSFASVLAFESIHPLDAQTIDELLNEAFKE
ncbi:hypothetical protein NE237_002269 [Protea cynaroides]|uniref:Uncharacterized protein n=1 Tax=Protea cynaroides TaxID=273540 RepID=A0A9Q0KUQ8_9MAGN|nr:hypothetical protein NE237_002269 [Protea cynaroides]